MATFLAFEDLQMEILLLMKQRLNEKNSAMRGSNTLVLLPLLRPLSFETDIVPWTDRGGPSSVTRDTLRIVHVVFRTPLSY